MEGKRGSRRGESGRKGTRCGWRRLSVRGRKRWGRKGRGDYVRRWGRRGRRGRGGGRRVGLMTIGVGGQWGGGPSL